MCFGRSSGHHGYHPYQRIGIAASRCSSMPPSSSSSLSSHSGPRPSFSHSGSPAPLRHAPPPYNPTKPLNDHLNPWDPDPVVSKFYTDQAKFFNDQKLLVSFDRRTKTYQLWNVPSYGFRKLSIALENKVVTGPYCHHASNDHRDLEFCKQVLIPCHDSNPKVLEGVKGYFTCLTHVCIAQPVNLFNERKRALKARQEEENKQEYEGKEDQEDKYEVAGLLQGSITPGQVSATTPSLLHSFERDRDDDIVTADEDATYLTDQMCYTHKDLYLVSPLPNHVQDSSWITPPNGLPLIPATSFQMVTSPSAIVAVCVSRFTKEEAESRKLTDGMMTSCLLSGAEDGTYLERPYLHPAFKLSVDAVTPAALKIHDGPEAVHKIWSRTIRGTPVTATILLLNSPVGISLELFGELRKRFHQCQSCLCYFSWDAYGGHLKGNGICANTPGLESVPNLAVVFRKLPSLPVEDWSELSSAIGKSSPVLASPVGTAWMSWNSPYGVTHDAWANLITAWRRCPGKCGMVRTFEGHKAHLESEQGCAKEHDVDFMLWAY
ncbi:hypothetical protein C8R41DRAFT_919996 [Lentinula lateritia]|uniref:Uncharacterized protein n=1 Tax=Lentinula lateritia TaxID=40482 RepID=A0ABQ8VI52_9AGAR|nr:hypothetical protein C8R41DRAFT_919996 [Lentinula lateritia]